MCLERLQEQHGAAAASEIFAQCSVYVTCEPCIMCASALAQVRFRTQTLLPKTPFDTSTRLRVLFMNKSSSASVVAIAAKTVRGLWPGLLFADIRRSRALVEIEPSFFFFCFCVCFCFLYMRQSGCVLYSTGRRSKYLLRLPQRPIRWLRHGTGRLQRQSHWYRRRRSQQRSICFL
eukprot:COSAG05_NODE_119_length_17779_cov_273.146049_19_plen_176_part_00